MGERERDKERHRDGEHHRDKDRSTHHRERDRERDRVREPDRERRDRDRDRDRIRDKERDRDRDRDRDYRDYRDTRDSRDRKRARSKSPPSDGPRRSSTPLDHHGRKNGRHEGDKKRQKDVGLDDKSKKGSTPPGPTPPPPPLPPPVLAPQADEEELMKKFGIPVNFDTSKGKCVPDANHSAVKLASKRQPRQYMNRRGGFNRPLPAELNR